MISVADDIRPSVRTMQHADVADVARIEKETYQFPWTEGIFRDCLLAGYSSLVMENNEGVLAYGLMSLVAGEAHILNCCVRDAHRRQGLARRLMQHLLALAVDGGAKQVFLEVRPSNLAALQLYRTMGFSKIGLRRAYYRANEGREDAVILSKNLG